MKHRNWLCIPIIAISALTAATLVPTACAAQPGVIALMSAIDTSSPKSRPPAIIAANTAGTKVDPRVVASDNAFGVDLFKTLSKGTGNIAISPMSVALALQVAYNGAAGTTQQSMARALRLGELTTQELNGANAALQALLMDGDTTTKLEIANSLWMHLAGNPVSPSFTRTIETYYGGTIGDLSGAPASVNAWVASETKGLIKVILPPESPGYYAKVTAIIANAIYFKGQWTKAFDPRLTGPAPFTVGDGSQTPSEMMRQTGDYRYFQGSTFQAVRIPYAGGSRSMLIVLPNPGVSLRSFVAGVTPDALNSWVTQFHLAFGQIGLPRFKSHYDASLPAALTSLGMGKSFCSSHTADFSGIGPGYCLSDVEHKAVVEVDEVGTVAAAATSVEVHATLMRRSEFTMTMDRPFLYVIRDDVTGELLFIGSEATL